MRVEALGLEHEAAAERDAAVQAAEERARQEHEVRIATAAQLTE